MLISIETYDKLNQHELENSLKGAKEIKEKIITALEQKNGMVKDFTQRCQQLLYDIDSYQFTINFLEGKLDREAFKQHIEKLYRKLTEEMLEEYIALKKHEDMLKENTNRLDSPESINDLTVFIKNLRYEMQDLDTHLMHIEALVNIDDTSKNDALAKLHDEILLKKQQLSADQNALAELKKDISAFEVNLAQVPERITRLEALLKQENKSNSNLLCIKGSRLRSVRNEISTLLKHLLKRNEEEQLDHSEKFVIEAIIQKLEHAKSKFDNSKEFDDVQIAMKKEELHLLTKDDMIFSEIKKSLTSVSVLNKINQQINNNTPIITLPREFYSLNFSNKREVLESAYNHFLNKDYIHRNPHIDRLLNKTMTRTETNHLEQLQTYFLETWQEEFQKNHKNPQNIQALSEKLANEYDCNISLYQQPLSLSQQKRETDKPDSFSQTGSIQELLKLSNDMPMWRQSTVNRDSPRKHRGFLSPKQNQASNKAEPMHTKNRADAMLHQGGLSEKITQKMEDTNTQPTPTNKDFKRRRNRAVCFSKKPEHDMNQTNIDPPERKNSLPKRKRTR